MWFGDGDDDDDDDNEEYMGSLFQSSHHTTGT
jgi:hypothetical protein